MNTSKIAWVESISFFLLANGGMLLGADFPPPVGFLWITLTAAILAAGQWFFVRWLLGNMGKRKTFGITLLIGALIGVAAFAVFTALRGGVPSGAGVWLAITVFAFAGYGLVLWVINRAVYRHLEKDKMNEKRRADP